VASEIKQFLLRWVNTTIGVVAATYIVKSGIHCQTRMDLVWAALALGILNAFVRPVLKLLSLPLIILTLGFFLFVINAVLLYAVSWLLAPDFEVRTFSAAFWGALIISLISGFLNLLTGANTMSVQVHRVPPRGPGPGDGGGPVIDV
jgi:putative membrane protein